MTGGVELLPCPFCGASAAHNEITDEADAANFGGHFIACTNGGCGASTNLRFASGDDPRPLLVEQWNRRSSAHFVDLLAACKALLPEGWDDGTMDHMPGVKLARAAIAKATTP